MRTVLDGEQTADLIAAITSAASAHAARRPGDRGGRQPVHTVYVAADRVEQSTVATLGREARRLLDLHAPDPAAFAAAFGVSVDLAAQVRQRVAHKLQREPVEDLRIDFEDGYGRRHDAQEDADAVRTAHALAAAVSAGTAPPFFGLRIKSFVDGGHERAIRTLDGFLTALLDDGDGTLPDGFLLTFPKVVTAAHVEAFATLLGRLERALGLADSALTFEMQVETVESIVDANGRVALPSLVAAAQGRMVGAHFGVFDYTAACGLPAQEQRLDHPACDFARHVMQVALAGTGVRLSDGSTNRVPRDDTTAAMTDVWGHHAGLVRRSLAHGFFQGWDLHPSHLVSRFAAVYAFHLAGFEDTTRRLGAWHTASASGDVLDEPATIRALQASLRRAVDCGAVTPEEASQAVRGGVAGTT